MPSLDLFYALARRVIARLSILLSLELGLEGGDIGFLSSSFPIYRLVIRGWLESLRDLYTTLISMVDVCMISSIYVSYDYSRLKLTVSRDMLNIVKIVLDQLSTGYEHAKISITFTDSSRIMIELCDKYSSAVTDMDAVLELIDKLKPLVDHDLLLLDLKYDEKTSRIDLVVKTRTSLEKVKQLAETLSRDFKTLTQPVTYIDNRNIILRCLLHPEITVRRDLERTLIFRKILRNRRLD